jgi:hypothetical protein
MWAVSWFFLLFLLDPASFRRRLLARTASLVRPLVPAHEETTTPSERSSLFWLLEESDRLSALFLDLASLS